METVTITAEAIEWMAEINSHHYLWNAQITRSAHGADYFKVTVNTEDGDSFERDFSY